MGKITLCRFLEEGTLETFRSDIEQTQFIAISHVWSNAQWTDIPGIPFQVLASPHKARYIRDRLPEVVKNTPFWMDILCVDQRSKAARIAVVNSIPQIYRSALFTLAIRDGDGTQTCCLQAIGSFADWSEHGAGRLLNHMARKHFMDGLTEAYLDRVWTLEEAFLSDVIHFDTCEENQPARPGYHGSEYLLRATVDAERIIDSLHGLGYTWIGHGLDGMQAFQQRFEEFVQAFLTNGQISRPPPVSRPLEVSSSDNLLYQLHLNSMRRTGKPRDFVFAIMSKYDWYIVPNGAGEMTFPQLFLDCHRQAFKAGVGFNCKFVSGLHESNPCTPGMHNWHPTLNIPIPQTLGDFLKLLGPAQARRQPLTVGLLANTIPDRTLGAVSTMAEAIQVIETTMRFSATKFHHSHRGGELSKHGRFRADPADFPDNFVQKARYGTVGTESNPNAFVESWLLPEAYTVLDTLWLGLGLYFEEQEAKGEAWQAKQYLLKEDPTGYKETMCMLAAMLSCGIPLSAFIWTKLRFLDMPVQLGEYNILCLVSIPRLRTLGWPISSHVFYAVERLQQSFLTGRDVFLTTDDGAPIGFLPDADATDDNKVYLKHMRALHHQIYIGKDGKFALEKELYVGVARDGVFRVGIETQGAEAPWKRNWDPDSPTYQANRPKWMNNFQVIRAE